MNLRTYAAQLRTEILTELQAGQNPTRGTFDPNRLADGRRKGAPQSGKLKFEPDTIVVEIIFPDPRTMATILEIRVPSPERIVWLAVPDWVQISVWEGQVSGSYVFETEAQAMLEKYTEGLAPEANRNGFGTDPAVPSR